MEVFLLGWHGDDIDRAHFSHTRLHNRRENRVRGLTKQQHGNS